MSTRCPEGTHGFRWCQYPLVNLRQRGSNARRGSVSKSVNRADMDGVPTFVRVVCRLEFNVTYLRLCRPACWRSFSLPSLSTVFKICNLILHTKQYIITSNLSLCPPGSGWPTHRLWPLLGHLYLQWCSFWTSSASHRKAT